MSKSLLTVILFCALATVCAAETDNSAARKKLWDIPTVEVKAKTIRSYTRGNIKVEEVYYFSRPYKNRPALIFGYYCYLLKRSGRLPAILISHGGGGHASLPRALEFAKRGYATLTIDLPGKGENRKRSRSTGPNMDVSQLLKASPDPSNNYLIHAVAAARNGLTYLTQRKEVDQKRLGMIGLSWGGVLTLLTNGQDSRLKAAVNVFGAGYIPEASTWEDRFSKMSTRESERWNTLLDPKNFLATQHAPILFITGTNDHCYYLPIFQKSYLQVTADKNFYLIPNLRHRFLSSGQVPALAWLDQHLKSGGTFPQIELFIPTLEGTNLVVPVEVKLTKSKLAKVRLYYTAGGPSQWTEKKWREVKPIPAGDQFYFLIPTKVVSPEVLFFVSAKDNHRGSASSLVRAIMAVRLKDGQRTYALCSAITKTYLHDRPVVLLDGTDISYHYLALQKKEKYYQLLRTD